MIQGAGWAPLLGLVTMSDNFLEILGQTCRNTSELFIQFSFKNYRTFFQHCNYNIVNFQNDRFSVYGEINFLLH